MRSGHASSAWYNPAATTTIDVPTATFGGTFIKLESGYTSPVTNHTEWMDEQCRLTGFFYGVVPVHDDWRLNLSVNAPYGMITQWPHDYSLNTLATFTSLRVCYISPSVAYRVSDELSLGVGVNAAIGVARLASYIDLNAYGQGQNKLYLRADAEGAGGFLSVFYHPWEDWTFGAHYQSKVKLNFKGEAKLTFCPFRSTSPPYPPVSRITFMPNRIFISVLLPAPFSPTRPSTSPSFRVRLMSVRT